jgi:hypothetical protein
MERKIMIDLGRKYKDKITGFEGLAIGFVTYISGCNQVLLAPAIAADGALREAQWFDEQRLASLGGDVLVLDNTISPGFDRPAPKR